MGECLGLFGLFGGLSCSVLFWRIFGGVLGGFVVLGFFGCYCHCYCCFHLFEVRVGGVFWLFCFQEEPWYLTPDLESQVKTKELIIDENLNEGIKN